MSASTTQSHLGARWNWQRMTHRRTTAHIAPVVPKETKEIAGQQMVSKIRDICYIV